jgi:di/tricarboxylate transporter
MGRLAAGAPMLRAALAAFVMATLAAWALGAVSGPPALPGPGAARWTLAIFGSAIAAWTLLDLDDAVVALVAALALMKAGVAAPADLYAAWGSDLVWLLMGGFVLAAVLQASGLADRVALRLLAGTGTVAGLLWRLTALIAATAFLIPSTSARAVLLLPLFTVLAANMARSDGLAAGHQRVTRAMALVFPSVILLSAGASLLGAGAHLLALDALRRLGQAVPGVLGWALWAAPFAALSCALATLVITRLFLTRAERGATLKLPSAPAGPLPAAQRNVAAIVLLAVVGLAISPMLGVDAALVMLAASLLATRPRWTGVDLKTALKKAEWSLLLFMAATLVLGRALLDSGAAAALMQAAWPRAASASGGGALHGATPASAAPGAFVALCLCAAAALLSHLLVTSRSARAVVLIPLLALPLSGSGVNPAAAVMLVVLGSGFCQTLAVSAKPVLVYSEGAAGAGFRPRDLLLLAAVMMPPLWLALVATAWWLWPLLGLPWLGH